MRSPVNDRVEHGVNYGQHLGDAGEVIHVRAEAILKGSDPLQDIQQEPSINIIKLYESVYESVHIVIVQGFH